MNFAIDKFSIERFGLITGSECDVLFTEKGNGEVGKRSYAKKLANQLFFKHYDEKSTRDTEHGDMAEHFAFIHYQQYYGADLKEGRWIKKGYCGGNTDAELSDRVIDFKCPTSLDKWLSYLHDGIDKQQRYQCQMYMYLTGHDLAELCAYLTETQFMNDNGLTYPVPEEKRMIITEVKKNPSFEDSLLAQVPSIIAMRNVYMETLQKTF